MARTRTTAAILAGQAAGALSRRLRLGGGTTLPGRVARRIAPDVLRTLAAGLPEGVVLVSGTNGKTTTTRMISSILSAASKRVLHNRAGANLISGLTATALADSGINGRPRATIGLFETDEAALPEALAETQPRLVVIHNLFRDQLDRYGEVDTLAGKWRTALATLPATSTVLLNADDPAVADLGLDLAAQVRYYGLDDPAHASGAAGHIADSQFCRRCGARYAYSLAFYAHIGHYRCPRCGHQRPEPDFRLVRLTLNGTDSSQLYLTYPGGALEVALPLPGLYNALNALAAAAATLLLNVSPATVRASLEHFSAAFGRIERVRAGASGPPMLIALIKNPVGASETVRMLVGERAEGSGQPAEGSQQAAGIGEAEGRRQKAEGSERADNAENPNSSPIPHPPSPIPHPLSLNVLIAINDRYADGTDISWLWDADFERLAGVVAQAVVSGTRAEDMAVRLKYAGIAPERITTQPNLAQALDSALATLPADATLYVLPTYTAMLELRADLAQRGWVKPFWEE